MPLVTSVQSKHLFFYSVHVLFHSRMDYYGLSRMKTMLLVWPSMRMPREHFEIGHSCLLPNSYLHSRPHFHLSKGYTAYLWETTSLNNTWFSKHSKVSLGFRSKTLNSKDNKLSFFFFFGDFSEIANSHYWLRHVSVRPSIARKQYTCQVVSNNTDTNLMLYVHVASNRLTIHYTNSK